MIYVSSLSLFLLLWSFLLPLQKIWNSGIDYELQKKKKTACLRTNINDASTKMLTFLSGSFPLGAIGGGIKDGTYLQE
jgi:hypothetical protein